jgi:hypothetical protein
MADANNHIAYSLTDIQRYLQGGMSAKEMHDLERAALEDPFLADALEGYSEADMQQAQQHLTQIETAIRQQKEESKVVALPALKKYRRWQVAASVILLISIAGISYFVFNKKNSEMTLAKIKSSSGSAAPATDTVQMRVQTLSPPAPDTTTIAKKERVGDEKNTSLLADNKIRNKKELQEPSAEAPVPMTAMKEDSDKAGISASNAIVMRAPNSEIAGTIIDNHQQPVPNAKVILQDSTQAVSDRNGNFSIPTNDSNAVASITAFGYKPVDNQKLRKGRNNITLKEKPFSLSDVEVTNLATKGRNIADTADVKPQGGWQSFQEYVYNKLNKRYDSTALSNNAYINGDLELEFSISEAGDPYDFKVLHAPDTQTANKAITAIKEGPKWISNDKDIKMRVTVKYK